MKVSDLQHHEVFTAQADESLDVAADRMNWHQVGALPVLEGQHLVGIITERDLTAALAEGADPVITPVSDYMTPAPEVLGPTVSSPTLPISCWSWGSATCRSCAAASWSVCCRCATS